MFKIYKIEKTDSTNSLIKRNINKICDRDVYVATCQEAGRGRYGHSFESPAGGLYMSVYFDSVYEDVEAPFVTVLAGIAVRRAIKEICRIDTKIKWPNDLFINDKKVCGILTEFVANGRRKGIIIGIGLNVSPEGRLPDIATSVFAETGEHYTTDVFADEILKNLDALYGNCDKKEFADELRQNLYKPSDEMDEWFRYYKL